jgi:hypothetical protein
LTYRMLAAYVPGGCETMADAQPCGQEAASRSPTSRYSTSHRLRAAAAKPLIRRPRPSHPAATKESSAGDRQRRETTVTDTELSAEAMRPASVQWTVTECDFEHDWVGTRLTFAIAPVGDGQFQLAFRHCGLTSELPCFGSCRASWDHFVTKSLRDLVESGHGHPAGSPADLAWRAQTRPTRA